LAGEEARNKYLMKKKKGKPCSSWGPLRERALKIAFFGKGKGKEKKRGGVLYNLVVQGGRFQKSENSIIFWKKKKKKERHSLKRKKGKGQSCFLGGRKGSKLIFGAQEEEKEKVEPVSCDWGTKEGRKNALWAGR